MAKSDNGEVHNKSSITSNSDPNNSLLKKVTSRVSGLLPTSISKWFGEPERSLAVVRRRESEELTDPLDNEPSVEPPKKRARNTFALSDTTFAGISSSGFSVTSTPLVTAGPSGYSTRKFDNHRECVNGDDGSDSGESSGYSSVPLPQKDSSSDKEIKVTNTPTVNSAKILKKSPMTPVRTLFSEQNLTHQTCMSSRRPSFNASTFGSPSFVDRTLSTNRVINSPFYAGRTFFGGAANRANISRNPTKKMMIFPNENVTTVQVKEPQKNDINHLSKTAKRILDALEHFSSPVEDAKKIPVVQKRANKPANRELIVPTVPDLLKMKLRKRIQDTTVAVRSLTQQKTTREYTINVNPERNKHSNKMKSKLASAREKPSTYEPPPEVNLPNIQLPITTLPKFDFNLPVPKPALYTFSNPIILNTSPKNITSINNFKFSDPIDSKNKTEKSNLNEFKPNVNTWECSTCLVRNLPNLNRCIACETAKVTEHKPAVTQSSFGMTQNSFGDKFKPASDTWECSICMIRNKNDAQKCVACETPKPGQKLEKSVPSISKTSDAGFSDLIKKQNERWECSACLVRNAKELTSCSSCGTTKPGQYNTGIETKANSKIQSSGFKFGINNNTENCSNFTLGVPSSKEITNSGFTFGASKKDDKNEPTKNTTETPRSTTPITSQNSFGDKFKPASDTWACDICMIRNKNDSQKCIACETPKPGAKIDMVSTKGPTFSFGIQNNKTETSKISDFTFGIQKSDSETCKSTGFTFGVSKTDEFPKSTGFTFGVPKTTKETKEEEEKNQKSETEAPKRSGFTFGVQKDAGIQKSTEAPTVAPEKDSEKSAEDKTKKSYSFAFGVQKTTDDSLKETTKTGSFTCRTSNLTEPPKVETQKTAGFNFGAQSGSDTKADNTKNICFGGPVEEASFKVDALKTTETTKISAEVAKAVAPVFGSLGDSTFKFAVSKATESQNANNEPTKIIFGSATDTTYNFGTQKSEPPKKSSTQNEVIVLDSDDSCDKTKTNKKDEKSTVNKMFAFSTTKSTPDSNKPGYDLPKALEPQKSAVFAFGGQPKPTENQNTFTFKPAETKSPVFNFGDTKAEQKPAVFNFGDSKVSDNKMFAFGGAQQTAPVAQFNFQQKPVEKFSFGETPKPVFGAPAKATGFGGLSQPQGSHNGGFNFGSVAAAPALKFGATNETQQATPVFNFGQTSSNTPSSGVFTFGGSPASSQAPSQAPVFNSDAKPSMSFSVGAAPSAFTTPQSSTAGAPVRKFRKAVRRVQPR